MSPRKLAQAAVQLLIELDDVEPVVWRRLLVPGSASLKSVHLMFQASMGWWDSHLHSFLIAGESYGVADEWDELELTDETSIALLDALNGHSRFVYEYDFGDGWTHEVAVEAILPQTDRLHFAVCLGGQNACPPEDVGGPGGYHDFLVAMADPAHEEHAQFFSWIGGPFAPDAFDIGAVNIALQRIR